MDEIFIQSIKDAGLYDSIWQAFAVFLPVQTVGVQGDQRTHSHVVALRAVTSEDGMTADWWVQLLPIRSSAVIPPLIVPVYPISQFFLFLETVGRFYFDHKFLDSVVRKICNSVRGVNRVCLDITSKPPATVEWE